MAVHFGTNMMQTIMSPMHNFYTNSPYPNQQQLQQNQQHHIFSGELSFKIYEYNKVYKLKKKQTDFWLHKFVSLLVI